MFYLQGHLYIRHSNIVSNRTNVETSSISRHWTGYHAYIIFDSCDIHAPSVALMSRNNGDGGANAQMYVKLYKSTFNLNTGLRAYCTNDYEYQNTRIIDIFHSTGTFSDRVLVQQGYRTYINGYNKINIQASTVTAGHLMHYYTDSYQYGMSPFELFILDSDVTTTGISVHFYHRNYYGHDSNSYRNIILRNSKIKTLDHFMRFENPDYQAARLYGSFIIEHCELDIRYDFLNVYSNMDYFNRFIFAGNKIIRMRSLAIVSRGASGVSLIDVEDAVFGDIICAGLDNAIIRLQNVVTNRVIDSGASNCSIEAKDSRMNYLQYRADVDIDSCQIGNNYGSNNINDLRGIIRNSKILNIGSSYPLSGAQTNLKLINCEIEGDFMETPREAFYQMYDCTVNDLNIPYFENRRMITKKLSPVFRLGGSDTTIEVTRHNGSVGDIVVDELRTELPDGYTKVHLYFSALNSPWNFLDNITIKMYIKDTNGDTLVIDATIAEDDSSWDGIPDTYSKFKATMDIVESGLLPVVSTTERTVNLLFTSPSQSTSEEPIYIDIDIKTEA